MNFDIDVDINDDGVGDIDKILSHLRDVVSFAELQLRERYAELLPYLRNSIASLPFLFKEIDDDEASQHGESLEEDHLGWQRSAPHIECSEELPWAAFLDLIAKGVDLRAEDAGGFW
ncbi:hypothetical protein MMC15_007882 [Xylographa vitiligo]|nr:hypothetical protein [Xylographa vitiligo]